MYIVYFLYLYLHSIHHSHFNILYALYILTDTHFNMKQEGIPRYYNVLNLILILTLIQF
jgi:fatty acid desaturase